MRYIIYTRVSTDKQDTISQIFECMQYVNSRLKPGDKVIHFEELDLSTRVPLEKRVKLQELINFVQADDVLVVYKLDRIARDGNEMVYVYRKLTDWGVKIHSLYESHVDKMNVHIHAYVAEMGRDTISKQTKSKLRLKQSRMEKTGTAWYGYKTDPTQLQLHQKDARSYGKPYKLIPDETEQRGLKMMVELREMGFSYQQIANALTDAGIFNRSGNPFQKMSIQRILNRHQKQNLLLTA